MWVTGVMVAHGPGDPSSSKFHYMCLWGALDASRGGFDRPIFLRWPRSRFESRVTLDHNIPFDIF